MSGDLGPHQIGAAVRGRFGAPLLYLDSVGSTNDEAMSWAASGAPEGGLVVAEHQSRGRGRRGRTWNDRPGAQLMFSLVLRPAGARAGLSLLTTALGVACAEAIEVVTGVPARLKWPNDVTARGRKMAGILLEARTRAGDVEVVIAGCGINFGWRRAEMPEEIAGLATSVAEERAARNESEPGRAEPGRAELLAAVLGSFEPLYDAVLMGRSEVVLGPASLRSEILGERVTAQLPGGGTLEGVATRLLSSGALEIRTGEDVTALEVGDVTRVRPV